MLSRRQAASEDVAERSVRLVERSEVLADAYDTVR